MKNNNLKFVKRKRFFNKRANEDPLSGVANLFDIGLVFVVSLLLALMSVYHIQDFFNDKSEITIMKKSITTWPWHWCVIIICWNIAAHCKLGY